jgi:hypothetical protein
MMEHWLGSSIKKSERSLSPLLKRRDTKPEKIVLGVLGTRSSITMEDLETNILAPIIEAWGIPDELIVPSEGESSHALQNWGDSRDIPVHLVCCDWTQLGRKAGIFRDARIQRDATHLLMLQGPRSNALMVTATRLARKGRHVVISERPGLPVSVPSDKKESDK